MHRAAGLHAAHSTCFATRLIVCRDDASAFTISCTGLIHPDEALPLSSSALTLPSQVSSHFVRACRMRIADSQSTARSSALATSGQINFTAAQTRVAPLRAMKFAPHQYLPLRESSIPPIARKAGLTARYSRKRRAASRSASGIRSIRLWSELRSMRDLSSAYISPENGGVGSAWNWYSHDLKALRRHGFSRVDGPVHESCLSLSSTSSGST